MNTIYQLNHIRRGAHGLPQAGVLAHAQLTKHLNHAGHSEKASTPGLWKHKWHPVMLALVVDDFDIEHVGVEHTKHLVQTLTPHCDITVDWFGAKFLGIDLEWDCRKGAVRLSMKGHIAKVLKHFQHTPACKPNHSPHAHNEPTHGQIIQCVQVPDQSPTLSSEDMTTLQAITGTLLFYTRAVDNKIYGSIRLNCYTKSFPCQKDR